jgi:hypothetical protein
MKSAARKLHSGVKAKGRSSARRSIHAHKLLAHKVKTKASRRGAKKRPWDTDLKKVFMDAVSDPRARWVWLD